MFSFLSIVLVGCLLALVAHYWKEFSQHAEEYSRQWFFSWMRRGFIAPLAIWVLMNVGKMPAIPPLTRSITIMRNSGHWTSALLAQTGLAGMVLVTFWGTLTFGWFLTTLFKRARNKDDLVLAIFLSSPVLFIFTLLFCYPFGWSGLSFALLFWIWPVTHYSLMIAQLHAPPPSYSQAIAKMKFGKYSDAEIAIIAQLEQCENDFDGWMMLAELYANQFHDLAEAEKTICSLCDEPSTTPSQMSIAMHRLADWQLKLRNDPAAARRILEELCRRLPGTHLATMARHRINQLPTTVKELHEQQKPRTVTMPVFKEPFEDTKPSLPIPVTPEQALASANQLVEQLQQAPNDISAREKLAKIFAEQLGQVDLAIEQLELLMGIPGQLPAKTAEWLGLMADWQINHRGEGEAAQKILERLVRDFPQSPQAFVAQRRLAMMKFKVRGAKIRA